jgi:cyclic beta-1,2-glucan synthetase
MCADTQRLRAPASPAIGSDPGPLRGELLSVEHLEERARVLAASYTLARNPRRRPSRFQPRLQENARALRRTYQVLAADVRRGKPVAPAAEWLLDNFHLVEAEAEEVRKNLPHRYYLELPSSPRVIWPAWLACTPWPSSSSATATPASTSTV